MFERNDVDEERLWEAIDSYDVMSLRVKERFHWKPRIKFRCPECQVKDHHDLQIRSWGAYEFFRRHSEDRREELWKGTPERAGGLYLDRPRTLLLGNTNAHKTAWLVISVLQNLNEEGGLCQD